MQLTQRIMIRVTDATYGSLKRLAASRDTSPTGRHAGSISGLCGDILDRALGFWVPGDRECPICGSDQIKRKKP